ncbi:MAG: glycosyltransferase [Schleiferiaceae bacterium]|jgi:glycosyltransferase involved in cell wall biosynthesis|nr:glycosyltransferase [Schleiferiaceae bacterium]
MPLFSVIIPVYNAESWIEECLNSVLNQTFNDFEIVLVNDGSSDRSAKRIRHILKSTAIKWQLIEQENKGLGNARNTAVAAANGEWLSFLDADDYWSLHKLLNASNFIKENPQFDWFYNEVYERYENGRMRERAGFSFSTLEEWVTKGNPIVPSATHIKKEVFQKHQGFEEDRKQVEDLGLWFKLFAESNFPGFLEETLTVYRLGSGLTQNAKEHFTKVLEAVDFYKDQVSLNDELYAEFVERKKYEFARQAQKSGNTTEALNEYRKLKEQSLKVKLFSVLANLGISI